MNTYDVGSMVILNCAFSVATTGAPIDPSTVTLQVQAPNGQQTLYVTSQLNHTGVGAYNLPIFANLAGVWVYRWEAQGSVIAAADAQFVVAPSVFAS